VTDGTCSLLGSSFLRVFAGFISKSYILEKRAQKLFREDWFWWYRCSFVSDCRITVVCVRLLCMGHLDAAVKLLVECEPEEENFLADQHLACLIATVAATGRSAPLFYITTEAVFVPR
jgi:hypothetical protein